MMYIFENQLILSFTKLPRSKNGAGSLIKSRPLINLSSGYKLLWCMLRLYICIWTPLQSNYLIFMHKSVFHTRLRGQEKGCSLDRNIFEFSCSVTWQKSSFVLHTYFYALNCIHIHVYIFYNISIRPKNPSDKNTQCLEKISTTFLPFFLNIFHSFAACPTMSASSTYVFSSLPSTLAVKFHETKRWN